MTESSSSNITMDETSPLLRSVTLDKESDLIDFDSNGDAENPLDWPSTYRWTITALLAFMAFVT